MPASPLTRPRTVSALHVVPSLDHGMGGSVQAALSMCDALAHVDVQSQLVSTAASTDRLDYLSSEFKGLTYVLFDRTFPHHYYRSPLLNRHIHSRAPHVDIVHVHGVFNFPAAYSLSLSSASSARIILSPHGQLDPYDLARHGWSKSLYGRVFLRRALRRVNRALVTSNQEGTALQTFGAPLRSETIPLPVRPTESGSGPRLRANYGIKPSAPLLLYLGRFHPKKRLDVFLTSVARIRPSMPALHVLLVGDGDRRYTDSIRRLTARLHLRDAVTWTGTLRGREKAAAFDAANLFVLTSENENFGITVAEALLAGLPTLISDQVHLQDTVARFGLGGICKPEVESCTQRLLELLSDPGRLALASERARTVAASLYSPEVVGERLRDLYLSVLEEQP